MLSDRQKSDLNSSIYEYLLQDAGATYSLTDFITRVITYSLTYLLTSHSLTYDLTYLLTHSPLGKYANTIKAFQAEGGIGSNYVAEGKQVLGTYTTMTNYNIIYSVSRSRTIFSHSFTHSFISLL